MGEDGEGGEVLAQLNPNNHEENNSGSNSFDAIRFSVFQNVTIPDANFLDALIVEGVDTNEDGEISLVEAEAIKSLNVSEEEISDLTGIEAFLNLDSLICSHNNLEKFDVSNITSLEFLNCAVNPLIDLDVSKNTSLKHLELQGGDAWIYLDVSSNTALEYLDCSWNNLFVLNVSNNTLLTDLHCASNQITSLDVSNNILLTSLNCGSNELNTLDVSNNTALTSLDCHYSQLTSLDVSNNTALEILFCASNELTNLDVSNNNTALTSLDCHNNQLTSLDVSNNTTLGELECGHNQLTILDVSNNTALTSLDCHNNQLTTLDISNNTVLKILFCHRNQLNSLDVSNSTALRVLRCSANNIASLDLLSIPEILLLNCSSNQIANLDISKNTNLNLSLQDTTLPIRVVVDWMFTNGENPFSPELILSDMPKLNEVCVWEDFFLDSVGIDTTGSPNVYFTTECSGGTAIENHEQRGLSIYPNPTSSLLTIETQNPDCYSLEIHSLNGQLIYKEEMEGNSKQIDMTPFSKGVYIITVRSDAWVRTEKVVKY